MTKFFLFLVISLLIFPTFSNAKICKKEFQLSIKIDDDWHKKEDQRILHENQLIQNHSQYISKQKRALFVEPFTCIKNEECDPIKNCQMEKNPKKFSEVEYAMKIDSGIVIAKSHCSVIAKCIGYSDFFHNKNTTFAEDRLIDIQGNNAVFYHHFYSANSASYEPPFNMTNFKTGYELYLDDEPHFSPNGNAMVEVRSIPKQDLQSDMPTGFNINIYEINKLGEYRNVEPAEIDPKNQDKVISTFLSRNPECGETPHFHSWKNNREVRLSMLPPSDANKGKKVILSYDIKTRKWGCKEDLFPEFKCQSYLPSSTKYSSNLATEQISHCPQSQNIF
jgi:hypothetical protein